MGLGVNNNLDKVLANLNSTAKLQQNFDNTKYICVFLHESFDYYKVIIIFCFLGGKSFLSRPEKGLHIQQ